MNYIGLNIRLLVCDIYGVQGQERPRSTTLEKTHSVTVQLHNSRK